MMVTHREWEIQVCTKAKTLAAFSVPKHRLDENDLKAFLKALVVRSRTESFEDMAGFYVNRRKGGPDRLPFTEIRHVQYPERQRVGYWCGDWEAYATALFKIDANSSEALKLYSSQGRQSEEDA